MSKPRLSYFEKEDVLHLAISDDAEAGSVALGPNLTAELNAQGALIGIEILNASDFLCDALLDSVAGRLSAQGTNPPG